ncbi:unnamed protein product [Lactuca virosa]|uniref:Rab-GAP TBC domain-containing protein n=1 Tax=Lactuca virosa TaxID=75947 RepID=A0AAU9MP29_9ASTR|nr:unnamed protein product [Lactuca virosa]
MMNAHVKRKISRTKSEEAPETENVASIEDSEDEFYDLDRNLQFHGNRNWSFLSKVECQWLLGESYGKLLWVSRLDTLRITIRIFYFLIVRLITMWISKFKKYMKQDFPQTFPRHPALDEGGRNALRCLLITYARHNPSVGYCQVNIQLI